MPYQNYTLASLTSLVYARLQNNTAFYVQAGGGCLEIQEAINEALRVFQLGTGYWRSRASVPTVAKRCVYALPAGAITPLRLCYNTAPLDVASVFDIDNAYPGWQSQTTLTAKAPNAPTLWGPFGAPNLFFIWPADAAGSNTLQLDYIAVTPVLVNQTDYVSIDSSMLQPIVDYCNHVLSFKRGGQVFLATMPMLQSFMRAMADRNSMLRASDAFKGLLGNDTLRTSRPRRAASKASAVGVR